MKARCPLFRNYCHCWTSACLPCKDMCSFVLQIILWRVGPFIYRRKPTAFLLLLCWQLFLSSDRAASPWLKLRLKEKKKERKKAVALAGQCQHFYQSGVAVDAVRMRMKEMDESSGSKEGSPDIILSPSGSNQFILMTPDRWMAVKKKKSVCGCVCRLGGLQKACNQTALKLALHNYVLSAA